MKQIFYISENDIRNLQFNYSGFKFKNHYKTEKPDSSFVEIEITDCEMSIIDYMESNGHIIYIDKNKFNERRLFDNLYTILNKNEKDPKSFCFYKLNGLKDKDIVMSYQKQFKDMIRIDF